MSRKVIKDANQERLSREEGHPAKERHEGSKGGRKGLIEGYQGTKDIKNVV
jgi:hypothetical protein